MNKRIELKGYITYSKDWDKSITCCDRVPDIMLCEYDPEYPGTFTPKTNLYDALDRLMGAEITEDPPDSESFYSNTVSRMMEYLILDTEPPADKDFETLAAEIYLNKFCGTLESDYIRGCYSVWTCGSGGIDYVLGGEVGHSIFKELASYEGKFVWMRV